MCRKLELCSNKVEAGSFHSSNGYAWILFFCRPAAKLQTVLSSLDSLLGQDNWRSRLFLALWRKYGHTEPCKCEREAELRFSLQNLCNALLKSCPRPQDAKCSKENKNIATRMLVAAFGKLLQKDIFAYGNDMLQGSTCLLVEFCTDIMKFNGKKTHLFTHFTVNNLIYPCFYVRKRVLFILLLSTFSSTINHDFYTL